jgi:hypothetical protein
MGEFSLFHWIALLVIIVVVFGGRGIVKLFRHIGRGGRGGSKGGPPTHPLPATSPLETSRGSANPKD